MFNLNDVKTALMTTEIVEKTRLVNALYEAVNNKQLVIEGDTPIAIPQPPLPDNVAVSRPKDMKHRGLGSKVGHQAMLHAIAHIEYNAINLGLDAVYRFREMPYDYYVDWLRVAYEEAYHFSLIAKRLQALDCEYGDFPVHGGLWQMCVDTEDDVLARMALVPRVMEARGLDVTPKIQEKLKNIGDTETVDLLDIIYEDEIGHVATGSHWFKYLCAERGLSVYKTFRELLKKHLKNGMNTEFNAEARLQAGFDDMELALLQHTFAEAK